MVTKKQVTADAVTVYCENHEYTFDGECWVSSADGRDPYVYVPRDEVPSWLSDGDFILATKAGETEVDAGGPGATVLTPVEETMADKEIEAMGERNEKGDRPMVVIK